MDFVSLKERLYDAEDALRRVLEVPTRKQVHEIVGQYFKEEKE